MRRENFLFEGSRGFPDIGWCIAAARLYPKGVASFVLGEIAVLFPELTAFSSAIVLPAAP